MLVYWNKDSTPVKSPNRALTVARLNCNLEYMSLWHLRHPLAAFAVWLPADSDTASGGKPHYSWAHVGGGEFPFPSSFSACRLLFTVQRENGVGVEKPHLPADLFTSSPPLITRTTQDYNRKPGLFLYQDRPAWPTDSFSECGVCLWETSFWVSLQGKKGFLWLVITIHVHKLFQHYFNIFLFETHSTHTQFELSWLSDVCLQHKKKKKNMASLSFSLSEGDSSFVGIYSDWRSESQEWNALWEAVGIVKPSEAPRWGSR